jgi:energy-coupling factor transport system ATP-binding protein
MITLRDVTVEFSDRASNRNNALDDFSTEIRRGEWIALIGPNGSGKTTLLQTVAGLVKPSTGSVDYAPGDRPRIALLFQDPDNQFVTTTVGSELRLSPPAGVSEGEISSRVDRAVERFDLKRLLVRNPHRLSGGEKQRLALAIVWLQDPDVLLLDEPLAYLDDETAGKCLDFVSEINDLGTTVLWATPGGDEITRAGRVLCMESGRPVFDGTIRGLRGWTVESGYEFVKPQLWDMADHLEHALGETLSFGDKDLESTASMARRLASVLPVPGGQNAGTTAGAGIPGPPDGPVVVLRGVNFGYGGNFVLNDIDFRLDGGCCAGLAGHNGSGKSSLLGLLAGVHKAEGGSAEHRYGRVAAGGSQNIFYLFQTPEQLFFAETVAEEIGFGLERLGLDERERRRRSFDALERAGLDPDVYLAREPLTLSPGEMRRVAFAIAISLEPALLLLDEPTSCLDPAGIRILESLIAGRRASGATTVVASHDASLLAGVCDRVVWLRDGRLECSIDTSAGVLPPGAEWPDRLPAVTDLQNHLAENGIDFSPRSLTVSGLLARLKTREN